MCGSVERQVLASWHQVPWLAALVQAAWEAAHRSELRALATGFKQLASYGTNAPLSGQLLMF